ncbi:MAG: hypothetical protein LBR70_02895 [Lactobacillaceae bacterium]|jgi:hypothetical protein|nr:hypothetical protein [Lactobacillaceae bacterium]
MENNGPEVYVKYISDGIAREYDFSFEIFESNNIEVYLDTEKQDNSYYVKRSGNSIGGIVAFIEAPVENTLITIIRKIPIKRVTDFKEGGPFRASKINLEFNYQLACLEQISEQIGRVISKPPYFDSVNLMLPAPKGGKTLVWNSDGTALTNSEISLEVVGDVYENACRLYNDSASALASLDAQIDQLNEFVGSVEKVEKKFNEIDEDIQTRSNKDFSNTEMADYIIEEWHAEDKTGWYKKYKSGWIEQGGSFIGSAGNKTITFLCPFSELPLSVTITDGGSSSSGVNSSVMSLSETGFTCYSGIHVSGNPAQAIWWQVKGY